MDALVKQLDSVLAYRDDLLKKSPTSFGDLTGVPWHDVRKGITLAVAAIERIGGQNSSYAKQARDIETQRKDLDLQYMAMELFGVVEALRHDVDSGYLRSVQELIHGELFTDFLEMSEHLLSEGYKDAAAVIAGSSLEGHLKKLCTKHGVSLSLASSGGPRPKKAEAMNIDLAKASAYSPIDQKNVTAWLGLRNAAAHGDYAKYIADQVRNLIIGVRDFVKRTPA
jgi:hypothetical protein